MRYLIAIALVFWGVAVPAWETPKRGTDLRQDLMDAARPHAEWLFGTPIAFVVEELRVSGDAAFAQIYPSRGGVVLEHSDLLPRVRGAFDPMLFDGARMEFLYRRSGRTWVAVHHEIGATDVWFADPDLCADYADVLPEFC